MTALTWLEASKLKEGDRVVFVTPLDIFAAAVIVPEGMLATVTHQELNELGSVLYVTPDDCGRVWRQEHLAHQNRVSASFFDTLFDPLKIILAQIGLDRRSFYHTARSGCPEDVHLALYILEGQNFALGRFVCLHFPLFVYAHYSEKFISEGSTFDDGHRVIADNYLPVHRAG